MEAITAKNFADCYLYSVGPYERKIFEFLSKAEQIDQHSKEFQDIIYDVKRRSSTTVIMKTLMHDSVVLLASGDPLPKAFKVFSARDIRTGDGKRKVFIDVSDLIVSKNGVYVCDQVDILTAYCISAMTNLIYYSEPRRLINNTSLCKAATECFCSLMNYIMSYMRINGYSGAREKIIYLSAMYMQVGIMRKPRTDSALYLAKQAAKINDKDVQVLEVMYTDDDMHDIRSFVNMLKRVLHLNDLTVELFIDRWVFLFGTGTQFGCELFPSFSTMLTNTYCGVYLNNIKTIEKQVGHNLADYTNSLLRLGSEAL